MGEESTAGMPGPEGAPAPDEAAAPSGAGAAGSPDPGAPGAPGAEGAEGESRSVIDASVDFVQTSVAYARQEIGAAVRDKAIVPVQQTAIDVAVLLAMALTIFLGIAFIAVGFLLVLAALVGWPAALFIVGGVLVVLGIVVMLVIRNRMEARKQSL